MFNDLNPGHTAVISNTVYNPGAMDACPESELYFYSNIYLELELKVYISMEKWEMLKLGGRNQHVSSLCYNVLNKAKTFIISFR